LEDHWDILPPKTIKDPEAKKPEDWVDEPTIVDETDTKPAGWDDIPEMIPDTTAKKPDDWAEEDGEWTPPLVRNPEYKGDWKPKRIPNPAYKGEWKHPTIANPEYVADPNLYAYEHVGGVGIEIWQVKSGTIFDNMWIGDSIEEAREFSKKTFEPRKNGEKAVKEAFDEANKPKEEEHAHPEHHEEEPHEETDEDFEEIKKEDL
jgi:calreticulin